jgi:hypothetical protein
VGTSTSADDGGGGGGGDVFFVKHSFALRQCVIQTRSNVYPPPTYNSESLTI